MKTTQRFTYKRNGDDRGFLLMPSEAAHAQDLLQRGFDMAFVFDRLTGYDPEGLTDIALEIRYLN